MIDRSRMRIKWISFFTVLKREVYRFLKIAVQTLLTPLISNLLFLGIFGGLFAGRQVSIGGVGYLQFISPGIIIAAVVLSAFQNPLFSLVAQKYQDTLRDYALFPLGDFGRMMAISLAGAIRGVLVGAATYAAVGLFSGFAIAFPFAFWLYMFGISFFFSLAGYMAGLLLDDMEKSSFIVTLFITPLMYLSGTFFDITTLPPPWNVISTYNPFAVFVDLSRVLYIDNYPMTVSLISLLTTAIFLLAVIVPAWIITRRQVGIMIE